MAHYAKYKLPAVSHMLEHYERTAERERAYIRPNIDGARTWRNVNLRPQDAAGRVREAVERHKSVTGRALRKDAVVMCDWVATLPRDCPPDRAEEFFGHVVDFAERRYGKERILGAYIHVDEATPHVHIPMLPVADDGRLAVKTVVDRTDLRTWHQDLQAYIREHMGLELSVLLDDGDKASKALSSLSQAEYRAAKDELVRLRDQREELRRQVAQEAGRLERLRCAVNAAREQVGELEAVYTEACQCEDARGGRAREAWSRLAGRAERARANLAALGSGWRGRARELADELRRARKYPRRMLSRAERRAGTEALRQEAVWDALTRSEAKRRTARHHTRVDAR